MFLSCVLMKCGNGSAVKDVLLGGNETNTALQLACDGFKKIYQMSISYLLNPSKKTSKDIRRALISFTGFQPND